MDLAELVRTTGVLKAMVLPRTLVDIFILVKDTII